MLLFPAIDLLEGKCVRLRKGDYAEQTHYSYDPIAIAQDFEAQGATWLHVVDLEGARSGEPAHLETVQQICKATNLNVELGGGLRTDEAIDQALQAGVKRAILGTRLVGNFLHAEAVFAKHGEQIVVGLDLRYGRVAIHGWTDTAGLEGIAFAQTLEEIGAKRFIVTDIETDGMLTGPNLKMLNTFASKLQSPVIASGGVSSLEDLRALAMTKVEGVIVGKALYEQRFTVQEALSALA